MNNAIQLIAMSLLWSLPPFLSIASEDCNLQEFEREYSEHFDVRPDVNLTIDCSFADIRLTSSEENEVAVYIEVRLQAQDKDQADRKFNGLDIRIDGQLQRVKVNTGPGKGWDTANEGLEIVVNISAPVNSILDLSANFGSLTIGAFGNKASVKSEFSELTCEGFTHPEVDIYTAHSSGRIRRFHGEKINLEYGSMIVNELNGSSTIQNSYGSIEIFSVTDKTSSLEIDNEFGSVSLNLASNASFRIEGESSFGEIELPQNAVIQRFEKEMITKEVDALIGPDPIAEMTINTRFGDVSIDLQ